MGSAFQAGGFGVMWWGDEEARWEAANTLARAERDKMVGTARRTAHHRPDEKMIKKGVETSAASHRCCSSC
jgi:hypothetical protein